MWYQKEFNLPAKPRGFHLITDEVYAALPERKEIRIGLAHIHLQHTSAALTLPITNGRLNLGTWLIDKPIDIRLVIQIDRLKQLEPVISCHLSNSQTLLLVDALC